MAGQKHIVIIGAGVTGLTSAVFLAEAGYKVTVVAAHVPGDKSIEYTSPWAGAHWRTHAKSDEPMLCDFDLQSFKYWMDIVENEDEDWKLPKSGLKLVTTLDYFDGPITEELWWTSHVPDFRHLSPDKEPITRVNSRTPDSRPKIANGVTYKAFTINVSQYLLYLQEKARMLGAEVVKARLPTDDGLQAALDAAERIAENHGRGKADCFVNASGLGALKLCHDENMYPIRGQTVLVRGESSVTITRLADGYGPYVIPRSGSGTTILGGTKQPGEWSEKVDDETTKKILEWNSWMVPELMTGPDGGFEVVSVQCGLRPGRKGGPRLEGELVGDRKVVHAYGHAGAGYQNSVGSARLAVKLVKESLGAEAQAKL